MIDCFDGMVVSWSISTRPDAELVNSMSDRGAHCRWPGWLTRIAEAKLVRSMLRKGYLPDNAACEGVCGRLKTELLYPRNWQATSLRGSDDGRRPRSTITRDQTGITNPGLDSDVVSWQSGIAIFQVSLRRRPDDFFLHYRATGVAKVSSPFTTADATRYALKSMSSEVAYPNFWAARSTFS